MRLIEALDRQPTNLFYSFRGELSFERKLFRHLVSPEK
jgi:hypothetical protein